MSPLAQCGDRQRFAVIGARLSHLSTTCLCRLGVHPSCLSVLVSLYPHKKKILYSSSSFPPLLVLLAFSTFSHTTPLPSIKVSLYCLCKRIGVVNRCRVIGSILAVQTGRGSGAPPLPHRATLFWWIAPTIHLNYVTGNELSAQSGPNWAQGLFLLTLPQHSVRPDYCQGL